MKGPEAGRERIVEGHGETFELTGGALCLDLANTLEYRPTARPVDYLRSFGDLLAWGEQAGAVAPAQAETLRRIAVRRRPAAGAVLKRARALRETLFTIFAAVAMRRAPPEAALASLNAALAGALRHARIAGAGRRFRWTWNNQRGDLDRILWPVIRSAAELLVDERLDRVRECGADNCAWLFLDTSRNRTRRWCDMTVCGNRAKARRYYRRNRKAARPDRG